MIAWIISQFGAYIAGAVAFVGGLGVVWLRGKASGKADAAAEEARHKAEAVEQKRKLDSEIDDLAPADVDRRFNRWVRKDDQR